MKSKHQRKRFISFLITVALAITASALETRNPITAYCVGITVTKNEDGNEYGFALATIEKEGEPVKIKVISEDGSFGDALKELENSDILLFFPTVKGIYIGKNIGKEDISDMIEALFALDSFPSGASVIRADDPVTLVANEDEASGIPGALFLPKLVEKQRLRVTFARFTEGEIAPTVVFSNGKFDIKKHE